LISQRFPEFADALEGVGELRERSMPLEHPLRRLRVVDPNLGTSEDCGEGAYLLVREA
jgi:hypothetical protein